MSLRVTVHALAFAGGQMWTGEIPDPPHDAPALEYVFRQFNRVDADDEARLARWGYELPSLSVGDEVELRDERWRCMTIGWQRVEAAA